MPAHSLSKEQKSETLAAIRRYGSISAAARAMGLSRKCVSYRLRQMGVSPETGGTAAAEARGQLQAARRAVWPLPKRGQTKRYIFTCAQNDTRLHLPLWKNLLALAKHYRAEIKVAALTYQAGSYDAGTVKRGKAKEKSEPVWSPEVVPYFCDESAEVAPGLIWCGEMNIIPTAVRPLSGLESYTGRKSGIFPHVKIALETIASGKFEGTKFNYTTGTVTQRNYIQKKAGQKAEFHHGYGALLVEVSGDGGWWCRQLNGDSEGTIYDLTVRASNGRVTQGHRAEAVQWGDIHHGRVSRDTKKLLWGKNGMLDCLRPKYQFAHDVLDWQARNHHDMKNFHRMYEKFVEGKDDVVRELEELVHFLASDMYRDWCETVVIRSNHDAAMDRWLREADYKQDHRNARFFLRAQLAFLDAIHSGDKKFIGIEWACRTLCPKNAAEEMAKIRFLRQDESFILCHDANGGIECGHHGDKGSNGARGALGAYAKTGRKTNTGDSHSPGIMDGAYRAGVAGDLDHGYNVGMSSWSNTHIVTYSNGKRALITCWNGKWRA